ncbi:MAG: hypothetical protein AB1Z98_35605 [Nannocystaceae bacterium]
MDFGEFYRDGGVFMHVITLLTLITGAGLLRRAGTIRRTFRDPNEQLARLRGGGVSVPSMVAATVMTGLLGTALGWISVQAAVQSVSPDVVFLAAARGNAIATYPLVWSLLCAVPLTLGHGVLRHFEHGLRSLIEKHA